MKDFISIINKPINKEVFIDGSKSISNRALIIAAMAKGKSEIKNLICGYITLTSPKVSDTLKKWDLVDVKTYYNIFQKQLSQNDGLIDNEDTLRTVIDGAGSKFNVYAVDDKHLQDMNQVVGDVVSLKNKGCFS